MRYKSCQKFGVGPFADQVAVTCSPFSKSLVAVGCSGGLISLIDMEKEKRYVLLFCYSDESCE